GAARSSMSYVSLTRPPPRSTLFPYTTLFRSAAVNAKLGDEEAPVSYAGAAPSFVGLDQVNVLVPRTLIGRGEIEVVLAVDGQTADRKSTRLNSSHDQISYAVFCLKKKTDRTA